jgi:DNA-binding transcriptional ArsR family regulator
MPVGHNSYCRCPGIVRQMAVNRKNTDAVALEGRGRDGHEMPEEVAEALIACGGVRAMEKRLPNDEQLARLGAFHRACSDPVRLKILAMLSPQPLCVCVIKEVLGIADSKLSYHLGVLRKAGLIEGEPQGNWIIYSLTDIGRTCAACELANG